MKRRRRIRFGEQLLVTDADREQAKASKAVAYWKVPARTFLKLTLPPEGEVNPRDFCSTAASIEAYNEGVRSGRIGHMPHLSLAEKITGGRARWRVSGHEGRHRACAVMASEGKDAEIEVALRLFIDHVGRTKAGSKNYEQDYYESEAFPSRKRRYRGVADIPETVAGQFNPRARAKIPRAKLTPAYSAEETEWHGARRR